MTADQLLKNLIGELSFANCVAASQIDELSQKLAASESENQNLKKQIEDLKGSSEIAKKK
jgi:cell division protein FtsB